MNYYESFNNNVSTIVYELGRVYINILLKMSKQSEMSWE